MSDQICDIKNVFRLLPLRKRGFSFSLTKTSAGIDNGNVYKRLCFSSQAEFRKVWKKAILKNLMKIETEGYFL